MNKNYKGLNIILHSAQMETNVKRYKARGPLCLRTLAEMGMKKALAKFRSSFTHNKGDLHIWH